MRIKQNKPKKIDAIQALTKNSNYHQNSLKLRTELTKNIGTLPTPQGKLAKTHRTTWHRNGDITILPPQRIFVLEQCLHNTKNTKVSWTANQCDPKVPQQSQKELTMLSLHHFDYNCKPIKPSLHSPLLHPQNVAIIKTQTKIPVRAWNLYHETSVEASQ